MAPKKNLSQCNLLTQRRFTLPFVAIIALLSFSCSSDNSGGAPAPVPAPMTNQAKLADSADCRAKRHELSKQDQEIQGAGITFTNQGSTFSVRTSTGFHVLAGTSSTAFHYFVDFEEKVNEFIDTCADKENLTNDQLFLAYKAKYLMAAIPEGIKAKYLISDEEKALDKAVDAKIPACKLRLSGMSSNELIKENRIVEAYYGDHARERAMNDYVARMERNECRSPKFSSLEACEIDISNKAVEIELEGNAIYSFSGDNMFKETADKFELLTKNKVCRKSREEFRRECKLEANETGTMAIRIGDELGGSFFGLHGAKQAVEELRMLVQAGVCKKSSSAPASCSMHIKSNARAAVSVDGKTATEFSGNDAMADAKELIEFLGSEEICE